MTISAPEPLSSEVPPNAGQVLLRSGIAHDHAGRLEQAIAAYEQAIRVARMGGRRQRRIVIEALRRHAVVRQRRNELDLARDLVQRSLEEARTLADPVMTGEALNTLGEFDIAAGDLDVAAERFRAGLELAANSAELQARIEQNLGLIATIRGRHEDARLHLRRALDGFDQHGGDAEIAAAFHHLGTIEMRRGEFLEAEQCFSLSAARGARSGDVSLEARCQLGRAEIAFRRGHHSTALRLAEGALEVFEQKGVRAPQACAYRIIGMVLRDSGRAALAEDRLRTAMTIARETEVVPEQAAAARELARLHQNTGRTGEAAVLLDSARMLFERLGASLELEETDRRIAEIAA